MKKLLIGLIALIAINCTPEVEYISATSFNEEIIDDTSSSLTQKASLASSSRQGDGVTEFFVTAHPDDWQLFMNPNAANAIKAGKRVVFVHMTSGDAGLEKRQWLSREAGSLRAQRFLKNLFDLTSSGSEMTKENITLDTYSGNKRILRYNYHNITSYFLRIPDSYMASLYSDDIDRLNTIDGVNTFVKNDVYDIVRKIMRIEGGVVSNVVHTADLDTSRNSGDHADHLTSAKFWRDVLIYDNGTTPGTRASINMYEEYVTGGKRENLTDYADYNVSSHDLNLINAMTWGVTLSGLSDHRTLLQTYEPGHNSWVRKQYVRNIEYPYNY